MGVPLLDLPAQYRELQSEIDAAMHDVMSTAGFIGGPKVKALEEAIAAYCGTSHAVGCGNGTDALILILEAMGIGEGDEVITSPFTFFATAESISQVGATPVFADIERDTYNIDATLVEAAITERTKAIMPVHIFGQCADMDAINAIARKHGLKVIEDACQAIGATYRDKRAGALGDAAAFSFFPSKNLGGAGDGGILTTDDADLAARARKLGNHGTAKKYFHDALGHNSRLDALQAAILSVKLPHLDRWNEERRTAAAVYDELLADLPLTVPVRRAYGEPVYHLYIVRTPEAPRVMEALKAAGIGTAIYYPRSLHLQEVYADLGYALGSLPEAEAAESETFAIPCFPGITREQQEEVARVLREALS
ncbi:MAG: DegT/DnrJ/EryC1/StrS family aminotransferase [Actinobacteria bacterium]|nr:DegT/DnrJ/EryC1/StrS family aminotransferase [Actinomycetota bacterium]